MFIRRDVKKIPNPEFFSLIFIKRMFNLKLFTTSVNFLQQVAAGMLLDIYA